MLVEKLPFYLDEHRYLPSYLLDNNSGPRRQNWTNYKKGYLSLVKLSIEKKKYQRRSFIGHKQ